MKNIKIEKRLCAFLIFYESFYLHLFILFKPASFISSSNITPFHFLTSANRETDDVIVKIIVQRPRSRLK